LRLRSNRSRQPRCALRQSKAAWAAGVQPRRNSFQKRGLLARKVCGENRRPIARLLRDEAGRERVDSVRLAQRYLTERSQLSDRQTDAEPVVKKEDIKRPQGGGPQLDPASVRRIAEFLVVAN